MTTYTLSYNDDGLICTKGVNQIGTVSNTDLLKGIDFIDHINGTNFSQKVQVSQQVINYLDCICLNSKISQNNLVKIKL